MNQQQTINKYVDLIKKYEKRKKSSKLADNSRPQQLLALTRTLFFKDNTPHIPKTKTNHPKQQPVLLRPTLKTLHIHPSTEPAPTKRKYQAYREEMEKKHALERQAELAFPAHAHRKALGLLDQPKRPHLEESQMFVPMLGQTTSLLRRDEHSLPREGHRSDQVHLARKACELDGSILHFESSALRPAAFRNMFHPRERNDHAGVYELLKTTSPLTVNAKPHPLDSRSFVFRPADTQPLRRQLPKPSRVSDRESACRSNARMHRRERSSLINLRQVEDISGWEFTEG